MTSCTSSHKSNLIGNLNLIIKNFNLTRKAVLTKFPIRSYSYMRLICTMSKTFN